MRHPPKAEPLFSRFRLLLREQPRIPATVGGFRPIAADDASSMRMG